MVKKILLLNFIHFPSLYENHNVLIFGDMYDKDFTVSTNVLLYLVQFKYIWQNKHVKIVSKIPEMVCTFSHSCLSQKKTKQQQHCIPVFRN